MTNRAQEGYVHYTVPEGMSALVKHFLAKSRARVVFEKRLTAAHLHQLVGGSATWTASTECGHQVQIITLIKKTLCRDETAEEP
jgi:hypothetical protein